MNADETSHDPDGEADFGFRRVAEDTKAPLVRAVFDSVARRYDLMNDLMSGGIHRLWKDRMVAWLKPRPGQIMLDVAGGTGDVACRALPRLAPEGGSVVVCDINEQMLDVGRARALDEGIVSGIEWICGDAEALPVADRSIDLYTIAFGLRNVIRIEQALAEARRVLKPGGRFLCLEFAPVAAPWLAPVYDFYSFRVLPLIGEAVTGDRDAYTYLVESIRRFPPPQALCEAMEAAGLERAKGLNDRAPLARRAEGGTDVPPHLINLALAEAVEGDDLTRLARHFLGGLGPLGFWFDQRGQRALVGRRRGRLGESEREFDRGVGKAAHRGEGDGQPLDLLIERE